jgi:hypothetical protein
MAVLAWGRIPLELRFSCGPEDPPSASCTLAGRRWQYQLPQVVDICAWLEGAVKDPGDVRPAIDLMFLRTIAGPRQLGRLAGVVRGARIIRLDARARLGTGDAAATAMLIGLGWSALALLGPWLRGAAPRVRLEPEFDRPWLEFDIRANVAVPVGRTLLAAASLATKLMALRLRRIARTWRRDTKAPGKRRRGGGVGS